ncbi:ABC transporter substrate binding protein [Desulfococcaceae bacterium HSG8]|nr:ABC transporter substrate binding protein [Desulfococcaceae bacterium HSG8]
MKELAPRVDAVYITLGTAHEIKNMPNLLAPVFKYKIPSFSQHSSKHVKHGVLMSISTADFKYIGRFQAKVIAKILNGARPGDIPQLFESPQRIVINMKTAQMIGFEVPTEALKIADEFYNEIPGPEALKK